MIRPHTSWCIGWYTPYIDASTDTGCSSYTIWCAMTEFQSSVLVSLYVTKQIIWRICSKVWYYIMIIVLYVFLFLKVHRLYTLWYIVDHNVWKTLMLYRSKKDNDISVWKWNGIGGKIESWESSDQGMIREIKEETWFDVLDMSFKGIITAPNFDNENCIGLQMMTLHL